MKSEDDSIHCFKPGQPCEAGRKVLLEEMAKLAAERDRDSIEDPFASEDDGEEDEANEAVIENDDDNAEDC